MVSERRCVHSVNCQIVSNGTGKYIILLENKMFVFGRCKNMDNFLIIYNVVSMEAVEKSSSLLYRIPPPPPPPIINF